MDYSWCPLLSENVDALLLRNKKSQISWKLILTSDLTTIVSELRGELPPQGQVDTCSCTHIISLALFKFQPIVAVDPASAKGTP